MSAILYDHIQHKLSSDTLIMPSLPDIALRVSSEANNPDSSLDEMAKIISTDPTLVARMIHIANTAGMSGNAEKVTSLKRAVVKIGLNRIKNVTIALVMEQLFVSKTQELRKHFKAAWKMSMEMTCHALAIRALYAERTGDKKSVDEDELALSGVVHNIGVYPIFKEVELQPKYHTDAGIKAALKMNTLLSGMIAERWDFPEDCVRTVREWRKGSNSVNIEQADFLLLASVALKRMDEKVAKQFILKSMNKNIIDKIDFTSSPEYLLKVGTFKTIFNGS